MISTTLGAPKIIKYNKIICLICIIIGKYNGHSYACTINGK